MKVYVLGHTGMLGTYVYAHFKNTGYKVVGINRSNLDVAKSDLSVPQLRAWLSHKGVKKDDVIINCMGTIKSMIDDHGTLIAIKVNSLFPHLLANACEKEGCKLIHITTDCVFSGEDGNYTEDSLHDCTDVYGKSKSLGEPSNCTVIRTSIIGEEVRTARSLIEWVKSQEGKTINGYTNHHWNGVTCHQLAKVFDDIIKYNKFWNGVRHIFSPDSVTKHNLVQMIIKIHQLNIEVIPFETDTICDRSLSTTYAGMNHPDTFNIPYIEAQLVEQKDNPPPIYT